MGKLTLILAIYNVEKYLNDCMNSIVKQELIEECEIILIDDGSTDNSAMICDEYEVLYNNVKVYHKTNGGLSDARNYGLRKATSEYVIFIDADDMLREGAVYRYLEAVKDKDYDIIVGDAISVDEEGNIIHKPDFNYVHKGLQEDILYSGTEAITEQLKAGVFQTTVWLGMYRREFLINNQLWFVKGLLHEDELWSPKAYIEAKTVKYIKNEMYLYRIRNNSISRSQEKDCSNNISSLIYIYSCITRYYEWRISDKELLNLLKDDVSRRYLHAIEVWDFPRYPYLMKRVNRKDIFRNSKTETNKLRAIILMINAYLYTRINTYMRNKLSIRGGAE